MAGTRQRSFDDERELRARQRRAYGPDPDIQDDPAALARLVELEAVARSCLRRLAADRGEPPADPAATAAALGVRPRLPVPVARVRIEPAEGSATRRSLARRLHVVAVSARSAVATAAGSLRSRWSYAIATLVAPRPDASLAPTGAPPDDVLIAFVRNSGPIDIDLSTLRSYETFRGIEPWSAVDDYGNPCLILIDGRGSVWRTRSARRPRPSS